MSADGTVIVFSEVLEGALIFSYDARARTRSQQTAENTRDITPSLSSGSRIAFARTAPRVQGPHR